MNHEKYCFVGMCECEGCTQYVRCDCELIRMVRSNQQNEISKRIQDALAPLLRLLPEKPESEFLRAKIYVYQHCLELVESGEEK
jgi:hypothetical protein